MVTIDSKDIKQEYGCTLLWGSFDSYLRYPKRAALETNNWAETNGLEVDLSEVVFEPRKIQLTFFQEADSLGAFWAAYNKLYAEMSAPGYRTLIAINGMATQLRLANTSAYKIPVPFNVDNMHTVFSLDFIEDNPNIGNSEGTIGNNAPYGMYQINGIDFGEFGIGSDDKADDLIKYTSIKERFTDGRTIYADYVRTTHKTVKLSIWMLAGSPSEFLNNWRAFFTQLSRPGIQLLYFDAAGISAEVYYSDCPSFKIERWDDRLVAARFAISLIVPRVDWISSGTSTVWKALFDANTNSLLADERGAILVI